MHEPRRILVVEDEPAVAMVLFDLLHDEGYAVAHAADGATGLRMVGDRPAELILLDLTLPRMTGEEFVRRLRALGGEAAAVPIVLVTGAHGGVDAAGRLGAVAALRKPFNLDELLATVRAALDGVAPRQR